MFLGRTLALLAALASTSTPIFAQTLRDVGWTSWQVAGARAAIGFALLAVWIRGDLVLARNHKVGVAVTVVNSGIGMSLYPYAAMHASLGTTVSVLYLSLVWVVLYQRLFGTPERFDMATTAMLVAGVVCVVGLGSPGDTWQGIAAAAVCSVTQAVYVLVSSRVAEAVTPRVLSCWALLGGTAAFGWQALFAPWDAPYAAVAAVGIGVVGGALYLVLAMSAFRRIGVETRVWLPFDLVFVWLFQAFAQGAVPKPLSLLGVALILSAALLLAWGKRASLPVPAPSS